MKRLRAILIGLLLGVGGFALAAQNPIPYLTGPQDPSQIFAYLNSLIQKANAEVFGYLTFGNPNENGELAIGSTYAFAQNGSINTGLTAVGPQGSHTTVQEWLVVINNSTGYIRFIPCF